MNKFLLHPILEKDTFFIGDFALCRALLMNNATCPWVILVPRLGSAQNPVRELYELTPEQGALFIRESNFCAAQMAAEWKAHKMNVAALGNVVEQLHIHHVARFREDPAWPAPVWGNVAQEPYSEGEAGATMERLRSIFQELLLQS